MSKVPVEETIFKLCRAITDVRQLEFLESELINRIVGEVQGAILDLCGVPADNSEDGDWDKEYLFVRDNFSSELDSLLTPSSEQSDFESLVHRMKDEIERLEKKTPPS